MPRTAVLPKPPTTAHAVPPRGRRHAGADPPTGWRSASPAPRRLAAIALACVAAIAGAAAPATAAPGTPGVPQPGVPVFAEDFENIGGTAIGLPSYVGGPAAGGTSYTADPYWVPSGNNCNGWVMGAGTPLPGSAVGCGGAAWPTLQNVSTALGQFAGLSPAQAAQNHAASVWTSSGGPAGVGLQSAPDAAAAVPGRFYAASVDYAVRAYKPGIGAGCATTTANSSSNDPSVGFYLLSGAQRIEIGSGLNPCTASSQDITVDGDAVRVARLVSGAIKWTGGSTMGVQQFNANGSGNSGNDGATDNIRIVDVTPQLDKAFVPARIPVGGTSRLTFTVTNTAELAAKNGWSFEDALPAGLRVGNPASVATTCADTDLTAPAGGTSVEVTGDIAQGQASCTVTVDVTAAEDGSYENGPDNVTTDGLQPPGDATLIVFEQAAFELVKEQRLRTTIGENANDKLTFGKQQEFRDIAPGTTETIRVECPAGSFVLDGSPVVQHVDQGTGARIDVEVLRAEADGPRAYEFDVRNPATGRAHVMAFVTCVTDTTTGGGALDPPTTVDADVPLAAGTTTRTLSCPAGNLAVAPGADFSGTTGRLVASQPGPDGRSWNFTVDADGAGDVRLSIRCLDTVTSTGASLVFYDLVAPVVVQPGETVEKELTCAVGYKGITASYDLPAGLRSLGNEPRPITRAFTLQNTTDAPITAMLDLLCVRETTADAPEPAYDDATLVADEDSVLEYRITVRNTGEVPLSIDDFADPRCDAGTLSGGPGDAPISPGQTAVWTCSHAVTPADVAAGRVENTASATGVGPGGGDPVDEDSNTVVADLTAARDAAATPPTPPTPPAPPTPPTPPAAPRPGDAPRSDAPASRDAPAAAAPAATADAARVPAGSPAPAPRRATVVTLGAPSLSSRALLVPVTCPAGRACTGTVTVTAARALRIAGRRVRVGGRLGSAKVTVRSGRKGTVRVALPRATARALAKAGQRRVVVTVKVGSTTVRRTVAVR